MKGKEKKALIIVDVQNDFCPGGALAVPAGDEVVPVINELIEKDDFDLIVATLDWHPENHCSFVENGGQWPKHCVQNTFGAAFHSKLKVGKNWIIIKKAFLPEKDAYSGFEGRDNLGRNLAEILKFHQIKKIIVVGLATEYCVKATALDGIKYGFEATVIKKGIRAVNVRPDDGKKAIEEMKNAGIKII